MKRITRFLCAGALGTALIFVPMMLPVLTMPVVFAATDWDAMDEDEFYERLGGLSGEAVIAVMQDEDLDDPDIQSDVEGEIWNRAGEEGCDHLLDDELVEKLAEQAIAIAWEEFPSGTLDDEDDEDCDDGSCDDDEYYDDDDDEYYDDEDDDDESYDDDADDSDYADYAIGVLDAVNENRAAYGLAPLTLVDDLCEDADIRAEEIVENFSHTRPDGSSCFSIIDGS